MRKASPSTEGGRPRKRRAGAPATRRDPVVEQQLPRAPAGLAGPLLAWFARARRDLPWRVEPRDPYHTWISEVMLQQTRVDVVLPYYARFLGSFPTLRGLAEAPLDEVLAHWSGLGYYARARNLHRAAIAAHARYGGLPKTAAALGELPGFGPYTAAAVASLAFGEQVPLVDGNVGRVLSRVLRLPGDPAQVRALAWVAAPALLPPGEAGAFNEALMELGATICTPRSPRCGECPITEFCKAFANHDAEAWPAPKRQRERPLVILAAACLRRGDGAVLLARHPEGGLFGGLWDLPAATLERGPDGPLFAAEAAQAARAALISRGIAAPRTLRPLGLVEQALTHRELQVHLFGAALPSGAPQARQALDPQALRWVAAEPAALGEIGLSSLARKSLRACGLPAPRGAGGAKK